MLEETHDNSQVEFSKVQFWAENRVGIIALDNGTDNGMDVELLSELLGALSIAVNDSTIDAIVITGTETVFSTGVDICESCFESAEKYRDILNIGHSIATTLLSIRKPVISVVNGPAFDAGLELILLSDFVLSRNEVTVGFPGIWYNLPHFIGTPGIFSAIYGRDYLKMLSNKAFKIEESGIVTRFLPEETLMKSVMETVPELPLYYGKFKGEIFNNLRTSIDFERYDNLAVSLAPKMNELKSYINELKK